MKLAFSFHSSLKNKLFKFPFLLCLFILFISCKKEKNEEPVIEFIQPQSGIIITAGDSVWVEARVQDDGPIQQVTVQLTDVNGNPIATSVLYTPGINSFRFKLLYPVNNIYLQSGSYFIVITADDGSKSASRARLIQIQAIPLVLEKVIALTYSGNTVHLYEIDSLQGYSLMASKFGNYGGSSISSRYRTLSLIGKTNGDFSVFSTDTGLPVFQLPAPCPPSSPCFENLFFRKEMNFISFHNGDIIGYDPLGFRKFEVQEQGYFVPGASFQTDSYFFAELYYPGLGESRLGTFFYPSGVARQEAALDFDILKMFEKSQGEIYLFGTSNGNLISKLYKVSDNSFTILRNFGQLSLYNVVELGSENYFLLTDQGIIQFLAGQNHFAYVDPETFHNILHEPLANEYYVSYGNTIKVLDAGSFNTKWQINMPDSVLAIHLQFNR